VLDSIGLDTFWTREIRGSGAARTRADQGGTGGMSLTPLPIQAVAISAEFVTVRAYLRSFCGISRPKGHA
jgi:hypothetical protein